MGKSVPLRVLEDVAAFWFLVVPEALSLICCQLSIAFPCKLVMLERERCAVLPRKDWPCKALDHLIRGSAKFTAYGGEKGRKLENALGGSYLV